MSAIDRLYSINNKTVKKSINIDDSLYKRLMRYTKKNYDATISDMINVCLAKIVLICNFLLFPAGKIGRMCVALVLYRGFAELLLWKNSPGGL